MDSSQRFQYGQKASRLGLIVNLFLFLIKLAVGFVSHSVSVIADAFNNLSDSLSSLVSFLSIRISAKPADQGHPYGHGRMEYLASFIVSILILLMGIELLRSSIGRLFEPEDVHVTAVTCFMLVLSILVKIFLFSYYRHIGLMAELGVLLVSAKDSLFDCLSTGITLLALLLNHLLPFDLDAFAGILLSVMIISTGLRLIREASTPLLGQKPDALYAEDLKKLCTADPHVLAVHDLQLHDYGYHQAMGSMHIELPDDLTFRQAHEIADRLEQQAMDRFGVNLVIHTDPIDIHSRMREKLLQDITADLEGTGCSLHDFQLNLSASPYRLSFDLLVPYTTDAQETEHLKDTLLSHLKQNYDVECMIHIDRG